MPDAPIRYQSADEDSARWLEFPFREGDIVISTRSKSGTTWMQMICALLVFQTPDLPAPLSTLSPWLDWLIVPRDEVYDRLAAQQHRRFIKTHTPLDGVPIDPRATYIVVARHPLDMAVSLYHQGQNLDRKRIRALAGEPEQEMSSDRDEAPRPVRPLDEWLRAWIENDADPRAELDSLPGVMWHLADAWARRESGNVVLVHYDDLTADLEGEMRRLADRLGFSVAEETWPALVKAASFEHMRANAEHLAPDPAGIMKSRSAFFRQGTSGSGQAVLSADDRARYRARTEELAPAEMLDWLHRAERR
ncbi:sulfotransferase domain-containing protein [Phytoactinopolyspora halotolerans]|uniref:Sulfotransferase domain-containing protein n=1 Tax=Phytoactinopolyspora halotolerans TaxID=1981512 RepID=A0A6L9SA83_9ACTN|nr:sulfotransferase domain-containing protein [Phytoactinopolyspora halotolerans]NEE00870.1 sulfotransferase domain-containing protein [Phytoactinopolyspora halotolerans]